MEACDASELAVLIFRALGCQSHSGGLGCGTMGDTNVASVLS